jgi:hypothetical protein
MSVRRFSCFNCFPFLQHFFVSSSDLFLPTHCRCRGSLLHRSHSVSHTHTYTHTHTHSVELLWKRDRPLAETFTRQQTIFIRDKHPCHRLHSNPQSQQASAPADLRLRPRDYQEPPFLSSILAG